MTEGEKGTTVIDRRYRLKGMTATSEDSAAQRAAATGKQKGQDRSLTLQESGDGHRPPLQLHSQGLGPAPALVNSSAAVTAAG